MKSTYGSCRGSNGANEATLQREGIDGQSCSCNLSSVCCHYICCKFYTQASGPDLAGTAAEESWTSLKKKAERATSTPEP